MTFDLLSQLALQVGDIEASLDFYVEKLGLRHLFDFCREDGTPWLYYLRLSNYQYIELIPCDPAALAQGEKRHVHHFTFTVADIAAAARELMEKGLPLYKTPSPQGVQITDPAQIRAGLCHSPSFFILDPDGNCIEIMQFAPDSIQHQYELNGGN